MKKITIILLACLCLSLSACGGRAKTAAPAEGSVDGVTLADAQLYRDTPLTEEELALLEEEYTREALTTRFTYDDFMADFDQLWDGIDRAYPYTPVLSGRSISTASIRETNRPRAEAVLNLPAFVQLLNSMLSQMQNFAQLSIVSEETYRRYAALDRNENLQLAPWIDAAVQPQTQACYELLYGPAEDYEPPTAEDYPPVDTYYYDDTGTVHFDFHSFAPAAIDRDRTVVADFLAIHPEAENIIFDITGVSGGVSEYWEEVILAPFGGEYDWSYTLYMRDDPLNFRYYGLTRYGVVDPDAAPPFTEDLRLDYTVPASRTYTFPERTVPPGASGARRWVLTDHSVYAASDAFAAFCRATGWAAVVGQQTMGDGPCMEPVFLTLENTGLLIQFSTLVAANEMGEVNAVSGTFPDHASPQGEAPLDTCLRLIRDGK